MSCHHIVGLTVTLFSLSKMAVMETVILVLEKLVMYFLRFHAPNKTKRL